MRDAIVRMAGRDGISCSFAPLTVDNLSAASEVFVCNAVYGILPVRSIDGRTASWEPGPLAGVSPRRLTAARPPPPRRPAASRTAPGRPARTVSSPRRPLVILVDNYDSFTYNLAHLIDGAGGHVEVVRNDEVSAAEVARAGAAGVVISPGPCARPRPGSASLVRACAGTIPCSASAWATRPWRGLPRADVRAPRPVHGQAGQPRRARRLRRPAASSDATRYHSLIVDGASLPSGATDNSKRWIAPNGAAARPPPGRRRSVPPRVRPHRARRGAGPQLRAEQLAVRQPLVNPGNSPERRVASLPAHDQASLRAIARQSEWGFAAWASSTTQRSGRPERGPGPDEGRGEIADQRPATSSTPRSPTPATCWTTRSTSGRASRASGQYSQVN